MKEFVYCQGDSQISFFSGEDRIVNNVYEKIDHISDKYSFLVWREGPQPIITLNTRDGYYDYVRRSLPSEGGSKLIFSYGEADCRGLLLKSGQFNETIDEYKKFVEKFKTEFDVYVFLPPASPLENRNFGNPPTMGTNLERNEVTKILSKGLKEMFDGIGVKYIDLLDYLIMSDGSTNMGRYWDFCHLSYKRCQEIFELEMKRIGLF